MTSESDAALLSALEAQFAQRASKPSEATNDERWAYRMAASVLTQFHLASLKPFVGPGSAPADNPSVLLPDVGPAPGSVDPGVFALTLDARRAALARLGTRQRMLAALELNSGQREHADPFQQMYESWLSGHPPSLEGQDYLDLARAAQIASWLEGIVPDIPQAAVVRDLANLRTVYALFENLATKEFTDREKELAQLREFAGVLPPATTPDAVRRQLRAWLGLRRQPPLVIEGPGGVGKSALIGRFLLEHADESQTERRFPFVYLAFDNPSLRPEEPSTLITEMTRQLRLIHREPTDAHEAFARNLIDYRQDRSGQESRAVSAPTRGARLGGLDDVELSLYKSFSEYVSRLVSRGGGADAPFVMVLDTFEEAQYRGRERLFGLVRMLDVLQRESPYLRIVISTRPPVPEIVIEELSPSRLALAELPRAAAIEVLQRRGVQDQKVAEALYRQVGGNPLNLQLAAKLVQSEEADAGGIAGIQTSSWLWFRVSEEVIRGQLYTRILSHIHDEDVRRLAHPGMVLRRVSADLIHDVLAGPCEVEVPDQSTANRLFEGLAREHTLVAPDGEHGLRYRPEIRTPLLSLLVRDRPQQVRAIHEGAVAFYADRSAISDRAEELYHRLALDQEPWELDSRWEAHLGTYLAGSIEELPPRASYWLAARLGVDVSPSVRKSADREEWERIVGRKARDLIRFSEPAQALAVINERSDRSISSPLFALEAKALVELGDPKRAVKVLDKGVEVLATGPNRGRLAEALWLLSQVLVEVDRVPDADLALEEAQSIATNIEDQLCLLQLLTQRLFLRRSHGEQVLTTASPIRERLAVLIERLEPSDMRREPTLVQSAAVVVSPTFSAAFARACRTVGVGQESDDDRKLLADRLEEWAAAQPDGGGIIASALIDLRSNVPLSSLLDTILGVRGTWSAVLPVLAGILESHSYSLSASNLAGIDAYREPWEQELSPEAA